MRPTCKLEPHLPEKACWKKHSSNTIKLSSWTSETPRFTATGVWLSPTWANISGPSMTTMKLFSSFQATLTPTKTASLLIRSLGQLELAVNDYSEAILLDLENALAFGNRSLA